MKPDIRDLAGSGWADGANADQEATDPLAHPDGSGAAGACGLQALPWTAAHRDGNLVPYDNVPCFWDGGKRSSPGEG